MTNKKGRRSINAAELRMSELYDMRLASKFGQKDEYDDWEIEEVYEELRLAGHDEDWKNSDLDAIETLFKKLNEADEIARRMKT
jgi:hypothetical protein